MAKIETDCCSSSNSLTPGAIDSLSLLAISLNYSGNGNENKTTYQLDGVMFKKVIYQLVFWWHFWLFFSVEHCTISATKWIFFVEPDDGKLQREFCTNKLVTKCCLQSASKRSLEDNSKSSFLYSAICYLAYVWETVESSFEKKIYNEKDI